MHIIHIHICLGAELAALELSAPQLEKIEKAAARYRKLDGALAKQVGRKLKALRALTLAQAGGGGGGGVLEFASAEVMYIYIS